MMKLSRRKLFKLGLLGGVAGTSSLAYGNLIERHQLTLEKVEVPLKLEHSTLAGLRIAMVSDFHFDELQEGALIARCVEKINAQQPDLIILCGDYVSHDHEPVEPLAQHLAKLTAPLGVFAVLGNHDHWAGASQVTRQLTRAGIQVLRNQAETLTYRHSPFQLAGLGSVWVGDAHLKTALPLLSKKSLPAILAVHEPDFFDRINQDPRIALQLSGHTHGGQVCAPFYGAMRLPSWGKNYISGLYRRHHSHIYVTRGVGTLFPHVRFCCPPEISLLTLTAPV
ncbi:MAG: metallophosphoesterase [Verrucomicrobiales bacterium]|nr:metallophosphoesterase [Verrucomicrobiales bacterium]